MSDETDLPPERTHKVMFEGQLTADDMTAALKLHLRPKRVVLYAVIGSFLVLAALAVLSVIIASDPYAGLSTATPILAFIGFWAFLIWLLFRQTARQLDQNPSLAGSIRGSIDSSGLELGGTGWESSYSWDKVYRVKTSPSLLLVYPAGNVYNIFPRRFFFSEEDWETVRRWAQSRVSGEALRTQQNTLRRNLFILVAVIVVLILLIQGLRSILGP